MEIVFEPLAHGDDGHRRVVFDVERRDVTASSLERDARRIRGTGIERHRHAAAVRQRKVALMPLRLVLNACDSLVAGRSIRSDCRPPFVTNA